MSKSKVAFDISVLNLTGGGSATYLNELMFALEGLNNDAPSICKIDYKSFFPRSSKLLRTVDTINRELIWQQFILPAEVKKNGADILHSPAMICPVRCAVPIILTALDAYIIRSPKSFSLWQRNCMNYYLPKSLERADRIIAISHFTKREILELFPHIPEEKITVTWLGVDKRFHIINDDIKQLVRDQYHFDKPFILSVSTIEPRKNLKTLIRAFARIKDKIDHDLVLTGAYGWKSKDLYDLISELKLNDRVKFPGYVNLEDLPAIYNLADLFIYPSLYEGFGLPPLEAMACGCPVITTNVASIPEVVGEAACTLDPLDIDALAHAMMSLVHDESERSSLKLKGLVQAAPFTWERCASETLDVYKSLS